MHSTSKMGALMCASSTLLLCNFWWFTNATRRGCHSAEVAAARVRGQHAREDFEVCILTSRRPDNTSYLALSLESLRGEGFSMQDVTLVDTDGSGREWAAHFNGVKLPDVQAVRKRVACIDDGGDVGSGVPCRVMQSNYDVAMTLAVCQAAALRTGKSWVLFMEDDVTACPGSADGVRAELARVHHEQVSLVSFSKFSRCFAVSAWYSTHMALEVREHAAAKPYDYVMWSDGWRGNSVQKKHPTNLFHHIGEVSTSKYRNEQGYKDMYSGMRSDKCGEAL